MFHVTHCFDEYLFAAVLLVSPGWAAAQQGAPAGHWEGSFTGPNGDVAVQIDLSVNAEGALVGMLATGEVQGLPLSHVSVEGRVVRFDIPSAGARFSGTLAADDQSIAGEFVNPAGAAPSVLTRTGDARVARPITRRGDKQGTRGKLERHPGGRGTEEAAGPEDEQPAGRDVHRHDRQPGRRLARAAGDARPGRTKPDVGVELIGGVYVASLTETNELAGTYTEKGNQFPLTFRR